MVVSGAPRVFEKQVFFVTLQELLAREKRYANALSPALQEPAGTGLIPRRDRAPSTGNATISESTRLEKEDVGEGAWEDV